MANQMASSKWAGMGLLSAIAASLCCITPILALVAGTSGLATTFSWVEPFRPYLIGLTVLVIGFAWYQKLKPNTQKQMDCACDCEETSKTPFLQSKGFLGIISIFAALMLAFPYYSNAFYPQPEQTAIIPFEENYSHILVLDIEGMTCSGCEAHVEHAANEVKGTQKAKASYAEGKAEIAFDPAQTTSDKIIEAVKTTGYTITASNVSSIKKAQ